MEDQDYILFEDYLAGVLTDDEVVDFSNRLQNDVAFNQAFNTYKDSSGFLEHKIQNQKASAEFKENLKIISEKHFKGLSTSSKIIKLTPWQYGMAASFVLLLGVLILNIFSKPKYKDFAGHDNISLTVRGTHDEILAKAENAFNDKTFGEAETYFILLLEKDSSNKELQLYTGIVLIELNKFDEADSLLSTLSKEPTAYKNKATWYFALSKLKQKDFDACIKILKTIPEGGDDFKSAQKLIKRLG
ncbi:MAG: hypothetical protein L3J29_09785 [Cyclobacteriaceae bacterium]|nr:hypothetical protein [Cyclobacteriaceae bacterium]